MGKFIMLGYEDTASGSEDESILSVRGNANQRSGRYGYSIVPLEEASGVRENNVKYKKNKKGYYQNNHDTDKNKSDSENENQNINKTKTKVKYIVKPKLQKAFTKRITGRTVTKQTRKNTIDFNVVFVVDYDMTLVDRNTRPFPGAKEFLRNLYNFNGGRSTLVLFSHATSGHIEHGLSTYFAEEANYFSKIIADHSMLKNKPVTRVRRVLSNIKDLSGPFCIIDDVRTNLDDDQYDITVDASRHFVRDRSTNRVVGIDYKAILCLLRQGVEQWLVTKTKGSSSAIADSEDE